MLDVDSPIVFLNAMDNGVWLAPAKRRRKLAGAVKGGPLVHVLEQDINSLQRAVYSL